MAVTKWSAPLVAMLVGCMAGSLATVAQMAWWWLAGMPVLVTLLRDTRLTAAIVLGREVLTESSAWPWRLLLAATLIHFALSIAYAALARGLALKVRRRLVLPGGALYGLVIYAVNLYGFTALFPWFVVSRGGATLFAHLVFGISVFVGIRLLRPDASVR
ncbi:hypothetical protein OL229_08025 [Neisseriaceae bacterium JH1-16]|nr:hypothetical protein [Neisseriaceae bacterium JH1-16]